MKMLHRLGFGVVLWLSALGCPVPERAPIPGMPVATITATDAGRDAH